MLDITTYIKEDLKKAGIKKYTLQYFHFDNTYPLPTNKIDCTNAVIYILEIEPQWNRPASLNSFDFEVNLSRSGGIKDVVFKFLNDIELLGVETIKYIKANFVK